MLVKLKMLERLPKDILIKIINYVGTEYKKKYFQTKNLFELVYKVNGISLDFYKCFHDKCNEFCFIDSIFYQDKLRIITSQNVQVDMSMNVDSERLTCGTDHGFLCAKNDHWVCANHSKNYQLDYKSCPLIAWCSEYIQNKNVDYRCCHNVKHFKLTYMDCESQILDKYLMPADVNDQILYNLPKDILIKLIAHVEEDYKKKYLTMNKLLELLSKLGGNRLKNYTCEYSSCNEICYIYNKSRDDPESGENLIVTTQTKEVDEVGYIAFQEDGEINDPDSDEHYNSYGIICLACDKWFCSNHWQKNIDKVIDPKRYFCKNCNMNFFYDAVF